MVVNYRQGYNMFACNGILFNHESPRRGETFVTRKITRALANILAGNQKKLYLGNLNEKRDWGFAHEYVEMMHLMLQQDEADDYVVGTGESHSVREFVDLAFSYAGIEIEWIDSGISERGVVQSLDSKITQQSTINNQQSIKTGTVLIEIDPRYFRPTEVEYLQADITKAKQKLGWEPRITFTELVKIMVDYDLKMVGLECPGEGIAVCSKKCFDYTTHIFSTNERIRE